MRELVHELHTKVSASETRFAAAAEAGQATNVLIKRCSHLLAHYSTLLELLDDESMAPLALEEDQEQLRNDAETLYVQSLLYVPAANRAPHADVDSGTDALHCTAMMSKSRQGGSVQLLAIVPGRSWWRRQYRLVRDAAANVPALGREQGLRVYVHSLEKSPTTESIADHKKNLLDRMPNHSRCGRGVRERCRYQERAGQVFGRVRVWMAQGIDASRVCCVRERELPTEPVCVRALWCRTSHCVQHEAGVHRLVRISPFDAKVSAPSLSLALTFDG